MRVYTYTVFFFQMPPFIVKNVDQNGTITFTGYCVDLLEEIKKLLNFEYTIFETKNKTFGTMDDNMNWDGMMDDLIQKVGGSSFLF